jgi:hypothetical protein
MFFKVSGSPYRGISEQVFKAWEESSDNPHSQYSPSEKQLLGCYWVLGKIE